MRYLDSNKGDEPFRGRAIALVFQGALFTNHSLAHVNRELCLQLIDKQYSISFDSRDPDDFLHEVDPRFAQLVAIRNLACASSDITIRHQWPPDFTPVTTGKLVLIQPWEFGSLPKSWIAPICSHVDEVWAYTNYVRNCYLESGVEPQKVHVVPLGVDTQLFTPDATPRPLATRKAFRFLFVGGTIHRKGIDILLGAYRQAFTAHDDVCLVIKDMGVSSFYQGQTAGEMIARFLEDPRAPEIEYIDRDLSPTEMAGLYTACHCLVHPYRGEGFGLPIAEAMACGLTPIVTGYGAALDFCPPEIAWLLPATIEKLLIKQVGQLETVDYPWLVEPDFEALVAMLRHVVSSPEEQTFRGLAAVDFIRNNFTWEHAARKADERLKAILQRPIRRLTCTSTLVASETYNSSVEASQLSIFVQGVCSKAGLLAQEGEVDQAVQLLLQQGIRVTPENVAPYCALVEILLRASRYQDALDVLPEMPTKADEMLKQEFAALCYCSLGDNDTARRVAELAAGRPRAMVVLGTLAARQGDPAEAERQFCQAIAVDSSCGSGWLSLGMLLWEQGKHDEAFAALKRAVTVDPLNCEAVQILRDMAERLDAGLAPCNTSIG